MGATAKMAIVVDTISVGRAAAPAADSRRFYFFVLFERQLGCEFAFFRAVAGGCGNKDGAV